MKRFYSIFVVNSLFLLASCGTITSNNTTSSSTTDVTIKNKASTSEINSNNQFSESSSSIQSSKIQETTKSIQSSQATTESTIIHSNPVNNSLNSEKQAMQVLISLSPELQNDDIVVTFYQMVDSDYLFNAQSKSILRQ